MIYENFFIKAKTELLNIPIELDVFKKEDNSYMTIEEYLTSLNHTVERFTNDGKYFIKGFGFNYATLKELDAKLLDYNLELNKDIWILSPSEVNDELAKSEWSKDLIKTGE